MKGLKEVSGAKFASLAAVMEAVREARDAAHKEGREGCGRGGYLPSRGMEFAICKIDGDKVSEGGSMYWDGKLSSLLEVMAKVEPGHSLYVEGGFDWAASPRHYADGDYDCWVSDWSVCVMFKPV